MKISHTINTRKIKQGQLKKPVRCKTCNKISFPIGKRCPYCKEFNFI